MYFSDKNAVVATIDPAAITNNGSKTSDWVNFRIFKKITFVLLVGATDTTVDFLVQESAASDGSNPQTITGKTITQLTGSNGDDKQVVIEVDQSELSTGYSYVSCKVTIGNGSSGAYVSAIGIGSNAGYEPASGSDIASVAQIVA